MASDGNSNFSHNKATLNSLRKGDLVEFKRGMFSHWGVYIGNGDIVHLTFGDDKKLDKAMGEVCKENFWEVVDKDKAIKNNDKDHQWMPLNPKQIVRNALSQLGEVGYSLTTKNCEHFAKGCRYGMEKSDQVDNLVTGGALAMAGAAVVGLVFAFTKYWGGSTEEDEKEEETSQSSKRGQNTQLHPTSG